MPSDRRMRRGPAEMSTVICEAALQRTWQGERRAGSAGRRAHPDRARRQGGAAGRLPGLGRSRCGRRDHRVSMSGFHRPDQALRVGRPAWGGALAGLGTSSSDRTAIADAALRSRKRNPGTRPGWPRGAPTRSDPAAIQTRKAPTCGAFLHSGGALVWRGDPAAYMMMAARATTSAAATIGARPKLGGLPSRRPRIRQTASGSGLPVPSSRGTKNHRSG
jgi:hypothetical protein